MGMPLPSVTLEQLIDAAWDLPAPEDSVSDTRTQMSGGIGFQFKRCETSVGGVNKWFWALTSHDRVLCRPPDKQFGKVEPELLDAFEEDAVISRVVSAPVYIDGCKFVDVSQRVNLTYEYLVEGHPAALTIAEPKWMHKSEDGVTHIFDLDGTAHEAAAGWIHCHWKYAAPQA